jgi:hypothetical protein
MMASNPNVPRCRLNWSLSCTVNAPNMIPAMNSVTAMVLRSDIGLLVASTATLRVIVAIGAVSKVAANSLIAAFSSSVMRTLMAAVGGRTF